MHLHLASVDDCRARDRLTHDAWGDQLTPAQFIAREERLRAHRWPRENLSTWFLRDDDARVLASCETYRMTSFLDGKRGDSFGIASVFTELELRKRGHATQLMDLVTARVRHDSPAAHALMLFSDVGAPIYERSGYVARPAEDLVFPPLVGTHASDTLLDENAALDAFAAREPFAEPFVIWPTREQLDWHLERARIYAGFLGRRDLPFAGAVAGASLMLWAADWKHDRLQVLLVDAARGHEAEALIGAARRCAARADLHEVRVWAEPWEFAGRPELGGDRVHRRDSLPMIAPLVPSLLPAMWTRIPRAVWM